MKIEWRMVGGVTQGRAELPKINIWDRSPLYLISIKPQTKGYHLQASVLGSGVDYQADFSTLPDAQEAAAFAYIKARNELIDKRIEELKVEISRLETLREALQGTLHEKGAGE